MNESRRHSELIQRHIDGLLTDEEAAALESMLAESDHAAADLVDAMRLDAQLSRHHRISSMSAPTPLDTTQDARPARSAVGRISRLSWAAAALLAASLLAIYLMRQPHHGATSKSITTPSAPVAVLSDRSNNAVFADGSAGLNLGDSLHAGPIRLRSGHAQIMFNSTAVVDLTGPCDFAMTGPNQGRLKSGTLEAYVPEKAHGFTVELPAARVVDLGTRFNADVDVDRNYHVQVDEGRVEVAQLDASGRTVRSLHLAAGSVAGGGADHLQPLDTLVRYHDGTTNTAPIQAADYVSAGPELFTGEAWRDSWGGAGPTPAGRIAGSAAGSQWRLFRTLGTPSVPRSDRSYFGFRLTYTGRRALHLDVLTFDWAAASNQGGGVGVQWAAFVSVNGGAFERVGQTPVRQGVPADSQRPMFGLPVRGLINLATAPLLHSGDRVELRLAVADTTHSNKQSVVLQGVRLSGQEQDIGATSSAPSKTPDAR